MSNINNKNSSFINGCNTHLVIKYEDIEKYLTDDMKTSLQSMLSTIETRRTYAGKTPINEYYICNKDEPYAMQVEDIILKEEAEKKNKTESFEKEL